MSLQSQVVKFHMGYIYNYVYIKLWHAHSIIPDGKVFAVYLKCTPQQCMPSATYFKWSACTSDEVCHWSMLQYTTVELLAHQSFPSAIEVSHKKCLSLNSACPVHYTSSEVQYFKRSTMYFVLKYPLKCSEVCFEVQRSAYFAALGLHCRRTWVSTQNCPEMAKNCCFQPQKFTARIHPVISATWSCCSWSASQESWNHS